MKSIRGKKNLSQRKKAKEPKLYTYASPVPVAQRQKEAMALLPEATASHVGKGTKLW